MSNQEELRRALEYPWEKWTVFLHPAQRQVVERSYRGPARISGSAGTGKTIVALHRAVHLARANPDARVLLTTFSTALADALRARVGRLIANEPKIAERLEVHAMADVGRRLYQAHFGLRRRGARQPRVTWPRPAPRVATAPPQHAIAGSTKHEARRSDWRLRLRCRFTLVAQPVVCKAREAQV